MFGLPPLVGGTSSMLLCRTGVHARMLDSDGGRSSVSSAATAVTSACAKVARDGEQGLAQGSIRMRNAASLSSSERQRERVRAQQLQTVHGTLVRIAGLARAAAGATAITIGHDAVDGVRRYDERVDAHAYAGYDVAGTIASPDKGTDTRRRRHRGQET